MITETISSKEKNILNDKNIEEQIKKCMLLLQSHTKDEEKFVALLILPKLLNPNDKKLMTIVFKEIDFVFLRRLLISEYSDNNDLELQTSLYKIISLNIISSFCYYPEFINDKRILKTIPYMISLLKENESLEVLNEILDIFILLTNGEKSLKEISNLESIKSINSLIINSNNDEIKEKGIKIFKILSQVGENKSVIEVLPSITEYFININSVIKFQILEFFVVLFANSSLNEINSLNDTTWLINIQKALKVLLLNKLGSSQNDNCLVLISSLIRMKGISFFFPEKKDYIKNEYLKNGDKEIHIMEDIQFLTLVTHLACTETRVLLDDYKDDDDIKEMNLKNEEKLKIIENQKRTQQMLPICYEIIEFMINLLVQYSESDNNENINCNNEIYNILKKNNINSKWILSFREALSETILALMEFVTEKTEIYKETQKKEKIDNIIVLLSVRILSSWLSENIEMFEKEISYIIPALIDISKIKPKSIDIIPINNISLVFSEITSNETYQEEFIKQNGVKILLYFLENNNEINENTLLNILITLINIVMLNPNHVQSKQTEWKQLLTYYNKYKYTKDSNITLYSYLIILELSILRLINSECNSENEKIIIEDSINYIVDYKNNSDPTVKNLWNLSFSILAELSEKNTTIGKILLLNTAKLVSITKDTSLSDTEKNYLNIIFNAIRKAAKN
ncbi:hypothetical protein BCR32DRAFT_272230 [Anaeromyces robustus]|uniref:Neurochondrin-domain-containing protein n=1 Tax=Anaeromyces robustus TaxID=1754192 RepID=A0A1Y1WGC8_9FUNG|nr:hypothetical protein BCR32DRAFT_272230 [Anaeromyces robustus]|eukprot:ORX72593.1 hypothetical protein BCR32DRAFT_272230 [Anaeromyces robustus]